MYTSTASAILLASIISSASAFVPMQIKPLPTDLDTNVWVPLTTLTAEFTSTTAPPSSQLTPAPSAEEILQILPVMDPNMIPDLKKRQGVTQAIAATAITQVSPITTYQIMLYRSGTQTQLNVVYTQTFDAIPDQWPSPTEAGTIGLGTIQGTIGVVKSKRGLPTQAPLASPADSTPTAKAPGSDVQKDESVPLLEKLRKAGKEFQEEFEALLNKVKKLPTEEEDTTIPLEKEVRLPTTTASTAAPSDPFSFSGSEEEATPLLPEIRILQNDGRVLKAGTLAMAVVAIGTVCVAYF